jgi:hypothetical protein
MEIVSTNRGIRRKRKQIARCTRSKKEQIKFSTLGTLTNGFLNHQFLPLFEQGQEPPDPMLVEKGFFNSLSILTSVYDIELMNVENKPYPYNILLAHAHIQKQLRKSEQDIELSIMQDDNGTIKLVTNHTYNTNMTLYYIPVLPLYQLLQNNKHKQTAELLLSVFAYLYHIAGIPYYRDDCSALSYYYEYIEEGLMDDLECNDTEQLNSDFSEFNKATYYGDVMLRKMYNPYHLNWFQQRIDNYKPNNSFQKNCLCLAKKARNLLLDYPEYSVFSNTSNQQFDECDGIIRAEQYISFIADNEGLLYENIARMVNDEFNECGEMEQPTIVQIYDTENRPSKEGLDFEYRLFATINDLCTILNNIP